MAMFGNAYRPRMMMADVEPGSPAPAGTMAPQPTAEAPKKPGMFGRMREGWNNGGWASLGQLGASILAANGNPIGEGVLGFMQLQRQREEDEVSNLYRAALAKKALEPDATWEPYEQGGQTYQRNSVTGEVKAMPRPEDGRTALQQNWDFYRSLPKDQQGEFMRMLPGFQYTPQGVQAAATIAGATAAAREPYQNGGGGAGMTPALAARLRAQAAAAIAAGADPAQVRARLAEQGL